MLHVAFLCLGTNLGDRLANLRNAVEQLETEMAITKCSPIYKTAPWGFTDQPEFLNQVVKVATELSPETLLSHLKKIERRMGRKRTFRYGPRLIDLDILFYDDIILDTPRLKIPHPHLHERAFVLVPLVAIAPHLVHPGLGVQCSDLLVQLDQSGIQRLDRTER